MQILAAIDKCQTEYALAKRLRNWGTYLLISLAMALTPVFAQTTAFTYQGTIDDNGQPANGAYDLEFALFDDPTSGTQTGGTLTINGVQVVDGSFSVHLDFGAEFPGDARWLEIRIKQTASGSEAIGTFTALTPRQQIGSSPYAIKSLLATSAETATNALQLDGTNADQYVLTTDPRMTDEREPASGSDNYIQNTTTTQAMSNFSISGDGTAGGTLTGDVVNAATRFELGGTHALSNPGNGNLFAGAGTGAFNAGFNNAFFGGTFTGASNTTGHGNSFFGAYAGAANVGGSSNSIFGESAGRSNTTGGFNAFFGASAGRNNTEGGGNSFFGFGAGRANTTGDVNTMIGHGAGSSNTSGSRNTMIGNGAGSRNNIGVDNTMVGTAAGLFNTEGIRNSIFGTEAGRANTTGNDNAFFGYRAGYLNTTGTYNSFFGFGAGRENTTGSDNAFFGKLAGYFTTEGASNSFLGSGAGYLNTTGAENTFVGKLAGASNTTGSSNTVLGASANVSAGDLTHATAIGAGAIVSESNTIQLGRVSGSDTVFAPGKATQPAGSPGWAKALLRVRFDGVVTRCYNGVTGSSSEGCGFTVERTQLGAVAIDFGFAVTSRFIVATPIYDDGFSAALEIAFLPTTPSIAVVAAKDVITGIPIDTNFTVIVF